LTNLAAIQEIVMALPTSRRGMPTWFCLVGTIVLAIGAWREAATVLAAQQRSIQPDAERVALMQKHFGQAISIRDGVIRGDLAASSATCCSINARPS
jgi:hypothetical protein